MKSESLTIGETVEKIRRALTDYIEATYHISHPTLVDQRKRLLDEFGVISQRPFLESTPRYQLGTPFGDLNIPDAAKSLLGVMAQSTALRGPLVFDPPYRHQASALEATIGRGKSLVLTTGTGSGKTESFLLPILAKLAREAQSNPNSFAMPAVRALVLYPMNALVNDQLGRLRRMFGDSDVVSSFTSWAGRPARFARYTSRTPYPGIRTVDKDKDRLRPIGEFFVNLVNRAADHQDPEQEDAARLIASLKGHGKWPAKPDLQAWFGEPNTRWLNKQGEFQRCVTLMNEPELLTRHEVLANPPDILVTNYSMLEYMLMRPLERPIFDLTRDWLAQNNDERLLLVIDEAHLYRGAAGTEVSLLLRRFRDRLGLSEERLQVICTSASFSNPEKATEFAADLSGKDRSSFIAVTGDLALRQGGAEGNGDDAQVLAELMLDEFYDSVDERHRLSVIKPFLAYRGIAPKLPISSALFEALTDFSPMSLLVNLTMKEAVPLDELAQRLFPEAESKKADRALAVLVALGSTARQQPDEPGILPSRVHTFFRGLPGIWACLDESCRFRGDLPPGPVGKVWSQPQDTCPCGARVFQLFTCRNCGAAYARAYTDDIQTPSFLWAEPGSSFESAEGQVRELFALDLLLEAPTSNLPEPAELDLVTGRLNPIALGSRNRQIHIQPDRLPKSPAKGTRLPDPTELGEFRPCGVCGQSAAFGRTTVQDHQTKGDQPFQALIAKQLQVQPPGNQPPSEFAPLQGRKVLIFSDSRQTAARLAPNLQDYSMRDALRPLLLSGWRDLSSIPGLASRLSLDDLFLSVLVASHSLGVRLRPKLKGTESLHVAAAVSRAVEDGALNDPIEALDLLTEVRSENPPESLLKALNETLTSRYFGLQSLALASVRERGKLTKTIETLPDLPLATDSSQKVALVRIWLQSWARPGFWFRSMGPGFWKTAQGVGPHSGKFDAMKKWMDSTSWKSFEKQWLPTLLELFTENVAPKQFRILAQHLAIEVGGEWAYCQACRTTQRPFPNLSKCPTCSRLGSVENIDPDTDSVFAARKGYYRSSSVAALGADHESPVSLIAAEHTAQLNAAQSNDVFSRAEEYELLFQDLNVGLPVPGEQRRTAVDVLSCTTTMEVGIDIGALSGVALRNMPPARSSYQQRAGRAGRRGNALATVLAFGSADSHDEQYFSHPHDMIRGAVQDPILTLDNVSIARRHMTAYLFQRYHEARLPFIDPEEQPQLFEVLGTVQDFQDTDTPLNRADLEEWLSENQMVLRTSIDSWLPTAIHADHRSALLDGLVAETLVAVDSALPKTATKESQESLSIEPDAIGDYVEPGLEVPAEEDEEPSTAERSATNLLDRLLYKGVLPRYAFPTDVVSFHVFDRNRSTRFRAAFEYSPSQGLPTALSQYAPGKEVWIDGKLWTSGALYSPMLSDRIEAWRNRRLYFECVVCRYACTNSASEASKGEKRDCPACGSEGTFGAAKNWIRPPGFAHPHFLDEGTSPDDQPAKSYATRAKLVAEGPGDPNKWQPVTHRLRQYFDRTHLLVTNSGPRREGYTYCTRCGRIGPTASPHFSLSGPHPRPYPDEKDPTCTGSATTSGLVLGTDFISDVLLIGLKVATPLTLRPGLLATEIALRTLSEAITIAGCQVLEIERGEMQAEFRPALTPGGAAGLEAEIYVYDTLAGGAGFAQRIGGMGTTIFEATLKLLEGCPADCDRSCYRCLRSFKNRFEHDLFDRHVGASLLRHLLHGTEPTQDERRLEMSTDKLFEDLVRHGVEGVQFERKQRIEIAGLGFVEAPILARRDGSSLIVGVHAPLTPGYATDADLREAAEFSTSIPVQLVDQTLVERHLPLASYRILKAI